MIVESKKGMRVKRISVCGLMTFVVCAAILPQSVEGEG